MAYKSNTTKYKRKDNYVHIFEPRNKLVDIALEPRTRNSTCGLDKIWMKDLTEEEYREMEEFIRSVAPLSVPPPRTQYREWKCVENGINK